jgi:hypothetical protein
LVTLHPRRGSTFVAGRYLPVMSGSEASAMDRLSMVQGRLAFVFN